MVNTAGRPLPAGDDWTTLDEFARWGRTTARNVRAWQSLGLLPAPVLRGRTGTYGPEHRRRLRAVLRLQDEGFSLAAIGALLAAWERGATLEDVLGLPRRVPERTGAAEPDVDPFADFTGRRRPRGRLLSVVPSSVLASAASAAS